MRVLEILSGIAVILTTLHLAHGMHHFLADQTHYGPLEYALIALAVIVGIFSFIGGCLLLKRRQ